MRLLFLILALSTTTVLATTNASSPPLNESDAFHNSAFGASQGEVPPSIQQEMQKQEEAPEWITPQMPLQEETDSNRVNQWQDQSQRAKTEGSL